MAVYFCIEGDGVILSSGANRERISDEALLAVAGTGGGAFTVVIGFAASFEAVVVIELL